MNLFMNTFTLIFVFNPLSANPTNWLNTLNNLSATADELFECVSPFCGASADKEVHSHLHHVILCNKLSVSLN